MSCLFAGVACGLFCVVICVDWCLKLVFGLFVSVACYYWCLLLVGAKVFGSCSLQLALGVRLLVIVICCFTCVCGFDCAFACVCLLFVVD